MAKVTVPLRLTYNQLTLVTSHPAVSQSLGLLEEEIKKKITKTYPILAGKIQRISFLNNPNIFTQKKALVTAQKQKEQPTLHKQSLRYKKFHEEALKQFADIHDEELKLTLINLFIQAKDSQNP